ncbi:MAG: MATE family efflux transporter [Desulfobulbaceae bacterium]|nr:MATE family efflux transporter [Desulfobulbaceae bacterium]
MHRSLSLVHHEAGLLIRLTLPLLFAQLSQTAMGFVDTVMAGRYAGIDLAAVAVGSSLFFPVFLFLLGLQSAVTPLVAQANGRGDAAAVRRSIRLGVTIGFTAGVLLMPLLWSMRPFMVWMGVSAEVIPITARYLFAISWGLPLGGVFFALKGGGDGLARPRLSMFAGFVGLAVNIVANALFIYGRFGLPELGGVGCGWASALSLLVMPLCLAWLLARSRLAGTGRLFAPPRADAPASSGPSVRGYLRLGLPLGLALFVECSIFALIALFLARLGSTVVAAHQIALNFTSLLYMLPYSLATALTVRTGFAIGRQRVRRLARIVRTGLGLALAGSTLTCLCIVVFREQIAALYTAEPAVRVLAASLLVYAAFFQPVDALQVNCSGILRGCRDTRVPLVLMLVAYWGIGLPLGYGLGMAGLGGMAPGPQGFWIGLIVALAAAAALLGGRVRVTLGRLEEGSGGAVRKGRP